MWIDKPRNLHVHRLAQGRHGGAGLSGPSQRLRGELPKHFSIKAGEDAAVVEAPLRRNISDSAAAGWCAKQRVMGALHADVLDIGHGTHIELILEPVLQGSYGNPGYVGKIA